MAAAAFLSPRQFKSVVNNTTRGRDAKRSRFFVVVVEAAPDAGHSLLFFKYECIGGDERERHGLSGWSCSPG